MVIINAGCQGHAGDLAAAGLAQSILPAESLSFSLFQLCPTQGRKLPVWERPAP